MVLGMRIQLYVLCTGFFIAGKGVIPDEDENRRTGLGLSAEVLG